MSNKNAVRMSFANSAKEAAVIIFSILVAFSLDAWWDDVKTDRDIGEILQAIESEMTDNIENLGASIQHHSDIQTSIGKILEESSRGEFSSGILTMAVIDVEIFEPNSGAMDTLVTAGLLGEVNDSKLRLLLGSYAALLQDLNEQEVRAAELRDAVRRRVASLGYRIWESEDQREAREDIETQNLLAMRAVEEGNAIASARALEEHIQNILARLEES